MEKIERGLGLCPVCGEGHIIKTNKDYVCTNKLKPSGNGKPSECAVHSLVAPSLVLLKKRHTV